MKDLMLKVSNMSVEMQATQHQSTKQTIMMNAIIDKIGMVRVTNNVLLTLYLSPENISCCGPPATTLNPSTIPPTPSPWETSPSHSSTVSTTTTTPGGTVCNCGIPNRPNRIFGGNETDPNEYPWVVFLEIGRSSLCGGALISNQHVMTIIVKPWPQTPKPKTKGPWADTKILWDTQPPHTF